MKFSNPIQSVKFTLLGRLNSVSVGVATDVQTNRENVRREDVGITEIGLGQTRTVEQGQRPAEAGG